MASICPPTFPSARTEPIPHKLNFTNSRFASSKFTRRSLQSGISLSRASGFTPCCRCVNSSSSGGDNSDSGSGEWRWDFHIQELFRNAMRRFDDYLSSFRDQEADGIVVMADKREDEEAEWDWERWMKHFVEVDDQERVVSILKSQLAGAVEREDYEDAARIKVAIAAASTNDTVGRVMSHLKVPQLVRRW